MATKPLKSIKFPNLPDTYTVPQVDNTLTIAGGAADAKAVGDEIDGLKEDLSNIEPLSEEAKVALLNCFQHVAWIDEHGQGYYDDLYEALYPESNLVRIEAAFNQGTSVIYEDSPLNNLKAYLTVTGFYNDGASKQLRDYALSGALTPGTSVITATVEGKIATFNVTVTAFPTLTVYVGKGISYDSETQITDKPKRCISEKIPFINEAPINVQWVGNNYAYRWALKTELPNGKMSTVGGGWFYDNEEDMTEQDISLQGWIYTENENFRGEYIDEVVTPTTWSESSGYGRIIFAPFSGMSDDLPSTPPSGYITITGTKYKIVAVTG